MKTGIKIELHRAFCNQSYYFALIAGCVLSSLQFVLRVLPNIESIHVERNMDYPRSVFNHCLMLDMGGGYAYLFFYAIILLATVPFGTSYYQDMKEGYIKNVFVRNFFYTFDCIL